MGYPSKSPSHITPFYFFKLTNKTLVKAKRKLEQKNGTKSLGSKVLPQFSI